MHPFERSGLASLTDLRTDEWRALFSRAEAAQTNFLAHEHTFRSPEYIWPRDPLHTWARCWEYPYALHQIERIGKHRLRVADVGSGVTFFPFLVAELGHEVTCVDIDPVGAVDIPRAAAALKQVVTFRQTDGRTLPFVDGELDVVYCLSVLEHIPEWSRTVDEMARVLKPGGALILTVDIDLLGNSELGAEAHALLMAKLHQTFDYRAAEVTVHPSSLLRSDGGPYPVRGLDGLAGLAFRAKQLIKPLLGRKAVPPGGMLLTVHGMALKKRS
jgi:SAM-dependent methyltransferase